MLVSCSERCPVIRSSMSTSSVSALITAFCSSRLLSFCASSNLARSSFFCARLCSFSSCSSSIRPSSSFAFFVLQRLGFRRLLFAFVSLLGFDIVA